MSFHARALQVSDWPDLSEVLAQSFNVPTAGWDMFRERLGDDGFLVVTEGERVVGGCGVYPLGQLWQGRSVPLGGVAGVGVAPEVRGRGAAAVLMIAALRKMHAEGTPVAGLYPATQPVYRKVGYEQAGERVQWEAPLAALTGFRQEVDVIAVEPLDVRVRAEFARRYRPAHGNLDRSEAIWARLCQPYVGRRYGWLLGEGGYVILQHAPPGDPHFDLELLDYMAPDAPTARSMLALLASHRSLATRLRWFAGPVCELLPFFPDKTWAVKETQRWMLRIVRLADALAGRGWADGAEGELHLRVHDPLFAENDGAFVLRVAGGKAELEAGGRGELEVPIRGLGPLYSGYYPASTLARLGWLSGPEGAVRMADRLFAAPVPWMREMY